MKRHLLIVLVFALCAFLMLGCDMADRDAGEHDTDNDTEVNTIDGLPTYVDTDGATESMTEEATHEAVTAEQTESDTEAITEALEIPLHLSELPDGETPLFAARVATVSGAVVLCNAPEQSPPYTVYWLGRGVPMAGDGVYFPYQLEVPEGINPDTITLLPYVLGGGGSGEVDFFGMAEKDGAPVYLHYGALMPDIKGEYRRVHCAWVLEELPYSIEQLEEMVSDFIIPLDVLDIYTPKMELG